MTALQRTNMTKDKKRGLRISIIFHVLLLLLLLIILPTKKDDDPNFQKAILIEFNSGSESEGAKPAQDEGGEEAEVEMERAEPVEIIQPMPEVSTPPILTTEEESPIVLPEIQEVDIEIDEPVEDIPEEEAPVIEEIPETKPAPPTVPKIKIREIIKILEPEAEEAPSTGTGGGDGSGSGEAENGTDSDNKGKESGQGKGESGDGKGKQGDGVGKGGKGDGYDFGDGRLTRPIIQQPSLTDLVKEEGILAFNLCVNRRGKVVFADYNSRVSTIKDKEIVQKALDRVGQYVFKTDFTAPERQCGTVTIAFEYDY